MTVTATAPARPSRSPARLLAAAVVAGAAVLASGWLATREGDGRAATATSPADLAPTGDIGEVAPAQPLTMWDGSTRSLANFRGRPMILNFFASYCVPCVTEMPDIEAMHQRYGDRVAFLGVNLRDRPADADNIIRETRVTYDLARDPVGDLAQALDLRVMPTTYFLDAEGSIVDVRGGRLSAAALEDEIQALLATA